MIRARSVVSALLVAFFWLAQIQATAHAIGHLTTAQSLSQRATVPHSVHCVECAAFAQAGAAPLATSPAPLLSLQVRVERATPTVGVLARGPAASYRSRAPPTTPR